MSDHKSAQPTIDSELDNILWKYGVWEDLPNEKLIKLSKDLKKWAAQEVNKAAIAELEEVKKYFPEYATSATAQLLLCVNNRIVILESQLTADKEEA